MQSKLLLAKSVASACIAAAAIVATPAAANSSAAAVDFSESVKDAGSPLGNGDQQFQELFASWKSQDASNGGVVVEPAVSVPSRMPLADARLTSSFGMRNHPVLGRMRQHKGIDLAAPSGTPVYATADGIVERADRFSSYGNYIAIDHGGSLETRFAHLSGFAVTAGEHVTKGQLIGYVGSTGRSTGPHLHYEIRVAGQAVNPIPYMVETDAQTAFALVETPGAQGGGEED
ncbi:M23 family metallopeptidase [Erythrobacter sp. LQ02-29]|uniref:M23 family metallopeptidase n=1 Tax=Erythrobacter sp. LQ02-29 TaxID=2920384 RepID=UPI001F4DCC93|nr:M23 family metallopeptidase [Erythrobacter sp. LQ02-29]MCP9221963.1 M23 family metallopeptidase [Erythrobacter sp. LQ02-29]